MTPALCSIRCRSCDSGADYLFRANVNWYLWHGVRRVYGHATWTHEGFCDACVAEGYDVPEWDPQVLTGWPCMI